VDLAGSKSNQNKKIKKQQNKQTWAGKGAEWRRFMLVMDLCF
jgi:hypothetical protein